MAYIVLPRHQCFDQDAIHIINDSIQSVILYENIVAWLIGLIGDKSALLNKIVYHRTVDKQLS